MATGIIPVAHHVPGRQEGVRRVAEMDAQEELPISVAVRFAHAVAQFVADAAGIDILHIKGPAVQQELLAEQQVSGSSTNDAKVPSPRQSYDADVLVRPSQVWDFIRAMESSGWSLRHGFEDDSVFGHAATLTHCSLGYVDVHRSLPGMERHSEQAFNVLFCDSEVTAIAGQPCRVPSITGHRLILILNAGRSKKQQHPDLTRVWLGATDEARSEVERLAQAVHAESALAAITGREPHLTDPEFELWNLLSNGKERSLRFAVALVRAQPTVKGRFQTAWRVTRLRTRRVLTGRAESTSGALCRSFAEQVRRDARSVARDLGQLARRRHEQ